MKEKHILKFVIPVGNGVHKKDMPVNKPQNSVPGKRIITYTCASGNGFRKDIPAIFYGLVVGRNGPSPGRNCQMYGRRTRTIRGMTNATGTNGTVVGSDKKTAGSGWKQAALEYQGLHSRKTNRRLTWKWNV